MISDLLGPLDRPLLYDGRGCLLRPDGLCTTADELEAQSLDSLLARLQLVAVQVEPYAVLAELVPLPLELLPQ